MENDTLIGALIGLAKACDVGMKTENTDALLLRALAAEGDFQTLLEAVRQEKNLVSPGCATCESPCGNTSDYDLRRIDTAEAEIRQAKHAILTGAQQIAKEGNTADAELLRSALCTVSEDLPIRFLTPTLTAIQNRLQ